jgi:hypothetical protein
MIHITEENIVDEVPKVTNIIGRLATLVTKMTELTTAVFSVVQMNWKKCLKFATRLSFVNQT